ncbi:hypothetical protein MCETALH18_01127 [Methylophilaceae bacterium]
MSLPSPCTVLQADKQVATIMKREHFFKARSKDLNASLFLFSSSKFIPSVNQRKVNVPPIEI